MSKSIRKEEFIVFAAIRTTGTDGKSSRELIMTGIDYDHIQSHDSYENFYDTESVLTEVRGFITNKNRFVDPKEALEITGWKNKLHFKDKYHLTPEDLLYFQSLIY